MFGGAMSLSSTPWPDARRHECLAVNYPQAQSNSGQKVSISKRRPAREGSPWTKPGSRAMLRTCPALGLAAAEVVHVNVRSARLLTRSSRLALVTVAATAVATSLVVVPVAAAAAEQCDGQAATIVGTDGDD